jgi:hypothetical protein
MGSTPGDDRINLAKILRRGQRLDFRKWHLCPFCGSATMAANMQKIVRKLFEQYEQLMRKSLGGEVDLDAAASVYASAFIAVSPAGIKTGTNDEHLKQGIRQGYDYYRAIGTKEMRVRNVGISAIDEHHCVAHVAWRAIYARKGQSDLPIDFDVHYLVQQLDGSPKIFGWISRDEQALLKKHGIG